MSFKKLRKYLSKKKTYVVGAGMIAYAGLGYWLKFMSPTEAADMAMKGAGLITLRAGISKVGQ